MRTLIAQNIAPPLVDVQIAAIRKNVADVRGVIAIAVPDSAAAPHAIRWTPRPTWAWPVRDGTTTRWVQEPEIADRYRSRFASTTEQLARLDEIWTEGTAQLGTTPQVWLVVAAVPDRLARLASQRRLLPSAVQPWLREMNSKMPMQVYVEGSIGIGRRRLILSDRMQVEQKADHRHIELHSDSGSFVANSVGAFQQISDGKLVGNPDEVAFYVEQEYLESSALTSIALAEAWARRQQAGGDMTVRASLWTPAPPFGLGGHLYSRTTYKLTNRQRRTYSAARRTLEQTSRVEATLPIASDPDPRVARRS